MTGETPWGAGGTPSDPAVPGRLLDGVEREPGNVTAPVLCESVDSGLLDTTLESFDLHYAVKTTLNPGPKDTGWMTEEQKAGG